MRNVTLSDVFKFLSSLSFVVMAIVLVIAAARAIGGPPHDPCAPCGPMSTLEYVFYGSFLGALIFNFLSLVTASRGHDCNSV